MPTEREKDEATGVETTGHEWDGIRELDNPMPKWWLYVFWATVLYSVIWWVLFPSFPYGTGYFQGILGYSQRDDVQAAIEAGRLGQFAWLSRIEEAPLEEIVRDPELLSFALAGGAASFADNCAPCHGHGGAGLPGGYPALGDDQWLWGGTLEDIHHTILYGVRFDHQETRFSEMPAFRDVLSRDELNDVAEYVLSFTAGSEDALAAERGAEVYAMNCAACHGERGEGVPAVGAPRLDNAIWLFGGHKEQVIAQIRQPQHGVMPAWIGRLPPETIKMLSVYVHSLGGGQ
jgi:cytochrome c oxidase cbb3-type subunit III